MLPETSPWHAALVRMLGARSSRVYMPAMLLALCELVDQGHTPEGVVRFLDMEAAFDDLIGPLFPEGVGKAWEPFFHLSRRTQLWHLCLNAQPADFTTLRTKRPKSRGALLKRANHAIVEPALWAELQHRTRRIQIAAFLRSKLHGGDHPHQQLSAQAGGNVGRPFAAPALPVLAAEARPIRHDPTAAHAGAVRHRELLLELADRLGQHQLRPLEPRTIDPQFDLGWRGPDLSIVEVKSLSSRHEEHQLRLGLGQVLEYRHRIALQEGTSPRAVLAVERQPRRPYWGGACQSVGVQLVFGPRWTGFP